jgi:glycerophosphoryl diester phosphodiesterase
MYFDRAFGQFIDSLRRTGLLNRSVIVVYGDHQSWLDTEDLQMLHTALSGSLPSALQLWRTRRQIPLMIRLPHGQAAGTRTVTGGLLDLSPTLLSLLGRNSLLEPSLGHDLTAAAQRLVVFRDGAFTDGRTFRFTTDRDETKCATRDGMALDCGLLTPLQRMAEELLVTSDRIVIGNLARPLADRLRAKPPPPRDQTSLEVIAHRGLSLEFPENTMPAILGAIQAGADAIELDIQLSKDGVPVVFHDDTLERTSNGRGRLASKTVAELKRLDVGRWKGLQFEGTRLPTLQEVLAVTGENVPLLLDLKADGMAAAIARVYAEARVPPATAMIGGWNGEQRADFAHHMPGARILRTEPAPAVWVPLLDRQLREQRVWGFEIGDDWPSSFVAEARFKGWPVIAYTVNDEPTMRNLIEMGVTAIETDDPKLLLRLKRELGLR